VFTIVVLASVWSWYSFIVKDEDTKLASPFTQPLTASMVIRKEKQAQEKAHPPGTSKILAKARKKAMEEEKKVWQKRIPFNLILIHIITKFDLTCMRNLI